jgi:predicted transcriptional regulator
MNFTPSFDKSAEEKKGKGFEPVTKYMATDLITFHPDQEIGEVIQSLMKNKISGAPVLNEKRSWSV